MDEQRSISELPIEAALHRCTLDAAIGYLAPAERRAVAAELAYPSTPRLARFHELFAARLAVPDPSVNEERLISRGFDVGLECLMTTLRPPDNADTPLAERPGLHL